MKKNLQRCLMAICVIASCMGNASVFAINIEAQNSGIIEPRAEQTEWYYRINNGILERRLWSLTNQCWLTDWEAV